MWCASVDGWLQPASASHLGCRPRYHALNFRQRPSYPRAAEFGRAWSFSLPRSLRCFSHIPESLSSRHPGYLHGRLDRIGIRFALRLSPRFAFRRQLAPRRHIVNLSAVWARHCAESEGRLFVAIRPGEFGAFALWAFDPAHKLPRRQRRGRAGTRSRIAHGLRRGACRVADSVHSISAPCTNTHPLRFPQFG